MPQPKSEFVSEVWKDGVFKDKVVFCTGGNGTICSQQVRAMVHLGADACIVGRNVEKTEAVAKDLATTRPGSKVIGLGAVDVRDVNLLRNAVDRCVRELGGIDFLMYVPTPFWPFHSLRSSLIPRYRAGAAGNFLVPLSQLTSNGFKTVIDIDVLGSFNVTKLCLPHLVASARKHNSSSSLPHTPTSGAAGRIIYVSATNHYTGIPLQTHVTVAKAGIDALSHSVAIEYGPLGVTSNVIAPGPIRGTEGMDRLSKDAGSADMKSATKRIPLGRWGSTKEIADATVFLFGDAGNYVNGATLVVDGGSWRMSYGPGSEDFEYPDFLLSGQEVSGVKGGRNSRL